MIDSIAALTTALPASTVSGGAVPTQYDIAAFRQSWDDAGQQSVGETSRAPADPEVVTQSSESNGLKAMVASLDNLNGRADRLEGDASLFTAGDREMTPSDMLMLTVHAHEFLFQCEITANVANRSSDGIQQLFRQQS